MRGNFKLYIKYILFNTYKVFFKSLVRNDKNTKLLISHSSVYYFCLHVKLSSLFYSTQLSDLFVYELPQITFSDEVLQNNKAVEKLADTNVIVYNFHSMHIQQRFFIFAVAPTASALQKYDSCFLESSKIVSISELFSNANWLEREAAELNALAFAGKKDLRNLMLQYGDISAPFQKSFPSIGIKEIFYDSASDLLIQTPVTIQF